MDNKYQNIYIAIDLKSFYASVECQERGLNPLTTNLVVADSSRTEKTICLAVSPSLKQYGIPGRARLYEVVQKVKEINASHISFFNNSLSYYRQSDMYYVDFSSGALNEKKVIDGASLQGMKLNSQITQSKVYYPDFDSDETGEINVKSTGGATLYGIKLKRGFVDFGVCKDKILYSATDGGLYTADLNGDNDRNISDGEYSVTSCSKSFALCYNSKNNTSVLLNVENGEFTTLASGYVKEFEYDSGVVFYSLKGENHIKEL